MPDTPLHGQSESGPRVPAHALRPGQTIWLNPGRAGAPRTVELVKPYPNDLDVSVIFAPTDGFPRAQLRVPRSHNFEVIA
jgi:hypothetical protein